MTAKTGDPLSANLSYAGLTSKDEHRLQKLISASSARSLDLVGNVLNGKALKGIIKAVAQNQAIRQVSIGFYLKPSKREIKRLLRSDSHLRQIEIHIPRLTDDLSETITHSCAENPKIQGLIITIDQHEGSAVVKLIERLSCLKLKAFGLIVPNMADEHLEAIRQLFQSSSLQKFALQTNSWNEKRVQLLSGIIPCANNLRKFDLRGNSFNASIESINALFQVLGRHNTLKWIGINPCYEKRATECVGDRLEIVSTDLGPRRQIQPAPYHWFKSAVPANSPGASGKEFTKKSPDPSREAGTAGFKSQGEPLTHKADKFMVAVKPCNTALFLDTTYHARQRMLERDISLADLQRALANGYATNEVDACAKIYDEASGLYVVLARGTHKIVTAYFRQGKACAKKSTAMPANFPRTSGKRFTKKSRDLSRETGTTEKRKTCGREAYERKRKYAALQLERERYENRPNT